MNCKNCDKHHIETEFIAGWCPACAEALIAHETQFRVRGDMVTMALAYDDWRAKAAGTLGSLIPIEEAMRRSFRAGWDARKRVAMLKRNPVGDKPGVCGEIPTDIVAQALGYLPICLLRAGHDGLHSWQTRPVGMCPSCGARISPKNDGTGDYEGCTNCGYGFKEDRITPRNKPPIGVMPQRFWREQRMRDLAGAIERYVQVGIPGQEHVFHEWIRELAELSCSPE